jgi:uncharacterized protein YggT (Ycf19 family)
MMLVRLVDLAFNTVQALMLAHVVLAWLRLAREPPRWIYHPVLLWCDQIGFLFLRPFRRLFERLGLNTAFGGLDFSPLVAFIVVRGLHLLTLYLLTR